MADNELFPFFVKTIYPDIDFEGFKQQFLQVKTINEWHDRMWFPLLWHIIGHTSTALTYSGLENLDPDRRYMFVSNHRDITLDAFLLQMELIARGRDTSYIVFGNNLMESPLLRDLFLSNNLVQMERGGGNPRAFYRSLQHLSQYLHKLIIDERHSVWIAQKNGRSKDGIDSTAPAIIKMLTLGSDTPAQQTIADLNIIPVAVSYEWDPCDLLKATELHKRSLGEYHKVEGEDTNSVTTGIIGPKGHIHLAVGKPLTAAEIACDERHLADHIAAVLDRRIQKLYKLMPTNYLAYDMLTGTNQHRQHYSAEVKNMFLQRMSQLPEGDCQRYFIEMYANPVISAQQKEA
jgi:1-acyl-sn-glycerol-3-phosphate acyltransferase